MRIRPCIDLHDGAVKQIVGGTLSADGAEAEVNYASNLSPAYFARIYREDGLTGGHVIMLSRGCEQAAQVALAEWPGGLQIGGGMNDEKAREWLDYGASAIIVSRYVFWDGQVDRKNLNTIQGLVGKDRLVLDLSCRKRNGTYWIVTNRWQQFTEVEINRENLEWLAGYCSEFLIHAADIEGLRRGFDHELVRRLAEWSPIPTTYAGGVRNLDDLYLIKELGRGRLDVTVGSALDIFGGSLSYREMAALNQQWNKENSPGV